MRKHSAKAGAIAILVMPLSLTGLSAPAQADTLCDSTCIYNQLISNQIPVQQGDGARQYGPFGWWVYYTGPNGLEIRLSHDTTWNVITGIFKAESGFAAFTAVGATSLADVAVGAVLKSKAQAAAIAIGWEVVSAPLDQIAQQAVQHDSCLAITIPGGSVGASLQRATNLMGGQFIDALQP